MPITRKTGERKAAMDSVTEESVFQRMSEMDLDGPVEFELPDSFKRWDSKEYIKIKRNKYISKKRVEDDSFCLCEPAPGSSSVCSDDCQNETVLCCRMTLSTCSSSCKCKGSCGNKPFQQRPKKKLEVVQTENRGLGVVADEDIKKGEFVIEYVGEVIDDKICEKRLWTLKSTKDTNFYLCEVYNDMVIDATYKGNKSRYINHSCDPNTEMQKWRTDRGTRLGIFSIKKIKKGEELTYDYQFVQFGEDQECRCGSSNCRKKLGSKPRKTNNSLPEETPKDTLTEESFQVSPNSKVRLKMGNCIGRVVRVWCSQRKGYFGGVILAFNCCAKNHTILFEDGRIELIDMSKQDWDFL